MDNTIYAQSNQINHSGRRDRYFILIGADGEVREISLDAFGKDRLFFGKNPAECDIVIPFEWVSRVHGKLKLDGDRVLFADVNSTNGTILDVDGYRRFLRGNPVYYELHNGNILRIQPGNNADRNSVMLLYVNGREAGMWRKLPVMGGENIRIGRDGNNSIVLPHPGVSRFHATIEKQGSDFILTDNNSTNGTLLNGQRVSRSVKLAEKDVIQILNSTLIFTDGMILYKSSVRGINIEVSNVNKYVGKNRKKILDQINCRIESNEFVAIIGGSGAGKTTFMNAINGFDRKTEGKISYNGSDLRKNFNELKSLIGYVPQEDIIYENLTLRRMLYFTARLKMPGDTSKKEINDRINQVLKMVELSEHQNTFIRKLSGGQKKRASIAVELLADPSVFFLDEPTSGLDPGTEQKLMMTLSRLSKTQGKTIVMVTHTTQSLQLCDKVIFMGKGGRMCFYGTTEQAKTFFQTDDLVDIYNMISDEPEFWSRRFQETRTDENEPLSGQASDTARKTDGKRKKHFPIGQVPVLLQRYIELICNDLQKLILLFVQPVAIALLLAVVANDNVFKIFEDTKSILFSLSCAAIWIGLFNSIQEICKERAVLKREYMGNLKLPFYVLSKYLVQTLIGFIQSALIVLIFALTVGLPEEGILFESPYLEMMITVWLTIEASMAMGFVISAFVRSGDKAMIAAPFVLIIQLLFSGILFELKGVGEYIAYATVSKWSVEGLGSIADLNSLELKIQQQLPTVEHEFQEIFEHAAGHLCGNWAILFGMMLLCSVICTIVLRTVAKDGR